MVGVIGGRCYRPEIKLSEIFVLTLCKEDNNYKNRFLFFFKKAVSFIKNSLITVKRKPIREIVRKKKEEYCVIRSVKNFQELQITDINIELYIDDITYDKITFPDWIKRIKIIKYNYDIDNLPNNLEELSIIGCDKRLDCLPLSLKKLYIEYEYFNNSLDFLPDSLEELTLRRFKSFTYSIDNLPRNLKKMEIKHISKKFNIQFLPSGIEDLTLSGDYLDYINDFPLSLKRLAINQFTECELTYLPPNLEGLSLSGNINPNFTHLPPSLINVIIDYDMNNYRIICDMIKKKSPSCFILLHQKSVLSNQDYLDHSYSVYENYL